MIERVFDFQVFPIPDADYLGTGLDQSSLSRRALHDAAVVLDMDRGRNTLDEGAEIGETANRIELISAPELIGKGEDVGWLAAVVEIAHCLIDHAVRGLIEILWAQNCLDPNDRIAVKQDTSECRLLRLEIVGRKAIDCCYHVMAMPEGRLDPSVRSGGDDPETMSGW